MAHVEQNQREGKITIHYGRNQTYGPLESNTHNLYLSRWIVKLLKQVGRLKEKASA